MTALAQQSSLQATKEVRKRVVKNPIPTSYTLEQLQSLTTLTPITSILQLNHQDLLIASGSQQSAMLTLVRDFKQSALAIQALKLPVQAAGIEEVFSLIFSSSDSQTLTQFIVLAMESGTTRLIEYSSGRSGEGLKEIDEAQNHFITQQKSLSVQKASTRSQKHFVLQVTATQVKTLIFQEESKMFQAVVDLDIGATGQRIIQALEIYPGSQDDDADETDIFLVVEDGNRRRSLAAYEFETLKEKKVFECIRDVQVHLACSSGPGEVAVVCQDGALILLRKTAGDDCFSIVLHTESNQLNAQAAILVDKRIPNGEHSYSPQNTCSSELTSKIQASVQKNIQKNWNFKQQFVKTTLRLRIVDVYVLNTQTK